MTHRIVQIAQKIYLDQWLVEVRLAWPAREPLNKKAEWFSLGFGLGYPPSGRVALIERAVIIKEPKGPIVTNALHCMTENDKPAEVFDLIATASLNFYEMRFSHRVEPPRVFVF